MTGVTQHKMLIEGVLSALVSPLSCKFTLGTTTVLVVVVTGHYNDSSGVRGGSLLGLI